MKKSDITEFVPVAKCAEELGISVRTLERARDRGEVKFVKRVIQKKSYNYMTRAALETYKKRIFIEVA